MDERPALDRRVLSRRFIVDRHSSLMLANAFELLTVKSVAFEPLETSVQVAHEDASIHSLQETH